MAVDDQVDRHHMRPERDIRVRRSGILQRLLHRPAGRVIDMDDPPVAVAAFAGEMQDFGFLVEGHAHVLQPRNRRRCILDHEFHGFAPVEAGTRNHRVVDMIGKCIARVEHGRNPALRPCRRATRQFTLGENQHLVGTGEGDRGAQSGSAGPDNDYIVVHDEQLNLEPALLPAPTAVTCK